ncbi:MAG: endonuclease III domain-containing protein [Bryobacteraceae bacterium]
MPHASLFQIVERLERHYGPPRREPPANPFEMLLWEMVAYLTDDDTRRAAFVQLTAKTGCEPRRILETPLAELERITRLGGSMAPGERAERMQKVARIALEEWGGDLAGVLRLPAPKAKKALMKFPGTGEPGAEKILLLTGTQAVLALDSNGLRVMQRLGFGQPQKGYAAEYRSVREDVLEEPAQDIGFFQSAHRLLRVHGQRLCTRNRPACASCPLASLCPFPGKVA